MLKSQPHLIAAAIIAVYIVLGILYESYIHPTTVRCLSSTFISGGSVGCSAGAANDCVRVANGRQSSSLISRIRRARMRPNKSRHVYTALVLA